MSFYRFRPTSHFIAPHSWANDPCGAIYIPETRQYLICYQWSPGRTDGGNSAWGMARSKDLVTWEDCSPAIQNGSSYDRLGVFSGSIVSRLVEGRRVLYLFYTSISNLPIHWSKPYIEGCETQSVALSTDLGKSWHKYDSNPLLKSPLLEAETVTGWRDPFVSPWPGLSKLLGLPISTDYKMISSGERGKGPQLHLYQSDNLLDWKPVTFRLLRRDDALGLPLGKNYECGSFFTLGKSHYILVGVEEDRLSTRHAQRYLMWLKGDLEMEDGKPIFVVTSHGLLDHGIAYAAHIFYDAEGRLIQLSWADETAQQQTLGNQGWAGCLAHPRELYEISKPLVISDNDIWTVESSSNTMTTLGIRPSPHLNFLRPPHSYTALESLETIQSSNYEIQAKFHNPTAASSFVFNIRQSPCGTEVTKIIFDLSNSQITVDRSRSSLLCPVITSPDWSKFELLKDEDLNIRIFVDNSVIEVYANDRFALTTRVYPSLPTSLGASYDFGGFEEQGEVEFNLWVGLKNAWPLREGRDAEKLFLVEKISMATSEACARL